MEKKTTSSAGEDMELLATRTLKIVVLKTSVGTSHFGKLCQYLLNSVNMYAYPVV